MTFPNRGRKRGYFKNIFLGLDQGIGTWFGLDVDEAISSYCGRKLYGKWQMKTIDWVAWNVFGDKDHCLNSIEKQYLNAPE